ncbi:MAG: endonuclease MutS2 [Thermonemataceae bacterium]|nr:endonuclease MutS2 [Thermonemataceae bacterium]
MLYPKNLEQKLGFDKIRLLLEELCLSNLGQSYIEKMRFSDDYDLIGKLTRQVKEFKDILSFEDNFPAQNFIDAKPFLQKAQIEGVFLSEEEFFELKMSLGAIQACVLFLEARKERFPTLADLLKLVDLDKNLFKRIDQTIDDRGKLKDTASAELQKIRREIISEQNNLRKTTDKILKQAKQAGWTNEDAGLTIRAGRLVIPITAEHKRKLKGFIHDESATGQTVYLEPTEILDLNNQIRELEAQERREIIRILTELTNYIRPFLPALQKSYNFLGLIDFIRAKALFALKINAIEPVSKPKTLLNFKNAVHPLLYLSHQEQGKKVVPLQIELSEKNYILVISGPNAGGKSVTLKTVGLLQYMWQCGLLIPVSEASEIGLFKNIFIDIGDEQSIENDLSTYSSHLTAMRQFVNFADNQTLFLIDEFGTGTEPRLGGAIAEAILEELYERKSFGVVNTHYGNLKTFAQNKKGITNGAMRFDMQNLEPLYQLEIGQAGSSFAFEIAKKIGLPKKVLAKAKERLDEKEINYDKLLKDLEQERKLWQDKTRNLHQKEQEYEVLLKKYQEQTDFLDNEKKKILNQAKIEAKKIIADSKQKVEQTIREIKEQKAEKNITKTLREELEQLDKTLEVENIADNSDNEDIVVIGGEIKIGDWVRIKGQSTVGEVLSLGAKDAEIRMGELRSNIKLNRLEKISKKEAKNTQKEFARKSIGLNLIEKTANFSYQLDLRGKSAEIAMIELDKFIDDAILAAYSELRILHGKGDGVLRKLVREQLKTFPQVASFASEHADRGGEGITIVKMK